MASAIDPAALAEEIWKMVGSGEKTKDDRLRPVSPL
jgi:hypothetical protein